MICERIVHIVDDEAGVRKATRMLLEASDFVAKLYESGEDFLSQVKAGTSGCVLLDIRMPGMDGLQVQQQMAERKLDLPIIVLTGHGDIATAVKAIRAGALEFLEKPYEEQALITALEAAFEKAEQAQAASVARATPEAEEQLAKLSRREKMVLVGLMEGKQNKVIAYELGLSPRTVEMYRARMMDKLSARSLSDVLKLGLEARRLGRL